MKYNNDDSRNTPASDINHPHYKSVNRHNYRMLKDELNAFKEVHKSNFE